MIEGTAPRKRTFGDFRGWTIGYIISTTTPSAPITSWENTMTEERKPEQDPWYPTIRREPLFYSFAHPQHGTGEPDNPVSLEKLDAEEEEPVRNDRVVREAIPSEVPSAPIKSAE
jgi:hypothetical protein